MKKYLVLALSFTLLVPATSFSAPKKPASKKVAVKKPVAKKPIAKKPAIKTAVVKPTPTPSPSTVVEAPKVVEPTPTPKATPAPIIFTFDNIVQNYGEISRNVYAQSQKLMEPSFQSKLKVNVFVGPNSKPLNSNPVLPYTTGSNVLRNFKQPDEVNAIYYSYVDREWAKKITAEKDGSARYDYQFEYECTNESNCAGASAGVTQNWDGIGRITATPGAREPAFYSGEVEIHEYTHVVSAYQVKPNSNINWYAMTPDWFSEGHATVVGKLGASKTFLEYNSNRLETVRRNGPDSSLKDYSSSNILRFYEAFMTRAANTGIQRYYLYTLGYSTIEALVAIGGIDSPMNLFLETAKGLTFEQAFKIIYGIDWKVAAPILAEVVSKQYMQYYP
jgi:hypothetical protein